VDDDDDDESERACGRYVQSVVPAQFCLALLKASRVCGPKA
jgi:hypothetical protein